MGKITKLAAEKLLAIMHLNSLDPKIFGFQISTNQEDQIDISFTKDLEYDDFEEYYGVKVAISESLKDLVVDFTIKGNKQGFIFKRNIND